MILWEGIYNFNLIYRINRFFTLGSRIMLFLQLAINFPKNSTDLSFFYF